MQVSILQAAITTVGTGASTAVTLGNTPFLTGRNVVAIIEMSDVTGSPSFTIEGRDSTADSYTVLLTNTDLHTKTANVRCYKYMRFNKGTAGTAGLVSARLEAD